MDKQARAIYQRAKKLYVARLGQLTRDYDLTPRMLAAMLPDTTPHAALKWLPPGPRARRANPVERQVPDGVRTCWLMMVFGLTPEDLVGEPPSELTRKALTVSVSRETSPMVARREAGTHLEATIGILEALRRVEARVEALERERGEGPEPPGQTGQSGPVDT